MDKIKGNFVRKRNESFLDLENMGREESDYKEMMLKYNKSENILAPQGIYENGKNLYRYSVSGLKSMELVFRTMSITKPRLEMILFSLVKALKDCPELLLDESDLVLSPEYVFMDIGSYSTFFVYLPGYGATLKKQLEIFFEFMLNRVDYDDKTAVELLYDCYTLALKEEKPIESLSQRINNEKHIEKEINQRRSIPDYLIDEAENKEKKSNNEESHSFGLWFRQTLKGKKKTKEIKEPKDNRENENAKTVDRDFLPEDFSEYEKNPQTVCLSSSRTGKLPYLIESKTGEVVMINKTPFYLGSMPGHNDYVINDKTVSRLHAQIQRLGDDHYILDLNSTNGTALNDVDLFPNKEMLLTDNDKIRISRIDFVFKAGDCE